MVRTAAAPATTVVEPTLLWITQPLYIPID